MMPNKIRFELARIISGEDWFQIKPTLRCNYRCEYCSMDLNHPGWRNTTTGELDVSEWGHIIQHNKAKIINICGGEPLLYEGLDDLIRICFQHKKLVYLVTNLSVYRDLPASWRLIIHATYHKSQTSAQKFDKLYRQYKQSGHTVIVYEFGKRQLPYSRNKEFGPRYLSNSGNKELQTQPKEHITKTYGPDGKLYNNCYLNE